MDVGCIFIIHVDILHVEALSVLDLSQIAVEVTAVFDPLAKILVAEIRAVHFEGCVE